MYNNDNKDVKADAVSKAIKTVTCCEQKYMYLG